MTVNTLSGLLDKMWQDYVTINPLALRTFNHPRVGVDVMANPFIAAGYKYGGDYHFPEKKLYAKHYVHADLSLPKIFISELKLEEFSGALQKTVNELVAQIPAGQENQYDFSSIGRPWKATTKIYNELLKESDYAAWVAAFGYRPNHFTVFINKLKNFSDIQVLNNYLKEQGFKLNSSGGEVKGSKDVCLEQSSTLANNIEVSFEDGKLTIPACYYEFAKRYALPNGELYQGFVAASADKIFESTSRGQ
jgi:hypothetical protein